VGEQKLTAMVRKPQTRDHLIERLQALAERLGHTPLQREVDADADSPCRVTYVRRFGSWHAVLEAAGLPPNRPPVPYDREMLLEALRQLADRLGRAPTKAEVDQQGAACAKTYANHFGSWTAALAEIGLQPRGSRLYERDELLSALRDLAEELGHLPSQAELWEREGLPRPTTYKYRFGSWNQALGAAGLKPSHPRGKQE
jgi:hypothetical protein